MFRTLSKNEYKPHGKRVSNKDSKTHSNVQIGFSEWQDKYMTTKQHFHNPKELPKLKENTKKEFKSASHFTIASEELGYKSQKEHFCSETMKHFPKYENVIKMKPVKTKYDLQKNQYDIGNNELYPQDELYKTQNNLQFYEKNEILKNLPSIKWKLSEPKWNLISHDQYNEEELKKASQFEFFNPYKLKNRVSRNYSELPRTYLNQQGKECKQYRIFNIITGRDIIVGQPKISQSQLIQNNNNTQITNNSKNLSQIFQAN